MERLRAKLFQAQEEIEYLKRHHDAETRDALAMVFPTYLYSVYISSLPPLTIIRCLNCSAGVAQ